MNKKNKNRNKNKNGNGGNAHQSQPQQQKGWALVQLTTLFGLSMLEMIEQLVFAMRARPQRFFVNLWAALKDDSGHVKVAVKHGSNPSKAGQKEYTESILRSIFSAIEIVGGKVKVKAQKAFASTEYGKAAIIAVVKHMSSQSQNRLVIQQNDKYCNHEYILDLDAALFGSTFKVHSEKELAKQAQPIQATATQGNQPKIVKVNQPAAPAQVAQNAQAPKAAANLANQSKKARRGGKREKARKAKLAAALASGSATQPAQQSPAIQVEKLADMKPVASQSVQAAPAAKIAKAPKAPANKGKKQFNAAKIAQHQKNKGGKFGNKAKGNGKNKVKGSKIPMTAVPAKPQQPVAAN